MALAIGNGALLLAVLAGATRGRATSLALGVALLGQLVLVAALLASERRARATRPGAAAAPALAVACEVADPPPALAAALQRAATAEAANAAKTRSLVAVGHEIRSPLNAIYGYAQLLERDGLVPAAEAGGVIRRSVEHLANLVEGLLEISNIEGGVVKLRTDLVQLPTLLDHVLDMFRMQAAAKGLELRYEVVGRLPRYVRTDEKRLRQILINLLSNAIKYTNEGSATLSIAYRTQTAEVTVADTGIGIAPEDLERIFEPFERGSSPDAALQPGIGLGLAITRALARILGGEIVATSTPGAGSRFNLRLFLPEPFAAPLAEATMSRVTGYRGPRRTVLVVDDHPSHVAVLSNLLRSLGFIVHCAADGEQGLALAERCRPDLVLLDVQMPGLDGWTVAARLRAMRGRDIRIVMVSADTRERGADEDGNAVHDALVAKPVDQEALLAVIGRELRLAWEGADEPPPAATPAPAAPALLPVAAEPWVERLRRLAREGQIRAVEATLDELEAQLPESAAAVSAMRDRVREFDLRTIMKMLDDATAR